MFFPKLKRKVVFHYRIENIEHGYLFIYLFNSMKRNIYLHKVQNESVSDVTEIIVSCQEAYR